MHPYQSSFLRHGDERYPNRENPRSADTRIEVRIGRHPVRNPLSLRNSLSQKRRSVSKGAAAPRKHRSQASPDRYLTPLSRMHLPASRHAQSAKLRDRYHSDLRNACRPSGSIPHPLSRMHLTASRHAQSAKFRDRYRSNRRNACRPSGSNSPLPGSLPPGFPHDRITGRSGRNTSRSPRAIASGSSVPQAFTPSETKTSDRKCLAASPDHHRLTATASTPPPNSVRTGNSGSAETRSKARRRSATDSTNGNLYTTLHVGGISRMIPRPRGSEPRGPRPYLRIPLLNPGPEFRFRIPFLRFLLGRNFRGSPLHHRTSKYRV